MTVRPRILALVLTAAAAVPGCAAPGAAPQAASGRAPRPTPVAAPANPAPPGAATAPARAAATSESDPRHHADIPRGRHPAGSPLVAPAASMCSQPGARCVSRRHAESWWGPGLLVPVGMPSQYLGVQPGKHFGAGDARRFPPSMVGIAVGATLNVAEASQGEFLAAGGIVVYGELTATPQPPPAEGAEPVVVRGSAGVVRTVTSVSTAEKHRMVLWSENLRSDRFVRWMVIDNPGDRSLDELVRIVDSFAQT